MELPSTGLHPWDLSPEEAVRLQKELASTIQLRPLASFPKTIAACDVSFDLGSPTLFAAIVLMETESLRVLEEVTVREEVHFPYVSGLLSFRELPVVLKGLAALQNSPDLILCDGQGIAHPRRMGIATHLGLWLQRPTIGSAKSLLCGKHGELGEERGATSPIVHRREVVGYAVRTRSRVSPVYVSPGHLCSLEDAVKIVLAVTSKYRIPDPIRFVHKLSNEARVRSHELPPPFDQPSSTV